MFQTAAGVTVPFPEKLSEQYKPQFAPCRPVWRGSAVGGVSLP